MSTTSSHLFLRVLERVLDTVEATWPYLVLSVLLASAIQVYVGTDRLGGWLRRSTPVAVLGAVALGALTPFCSCGTMAVVLGSLAASVPWAPVVAFLASSPLTSPGEYAWSVGLFGPAFATTFLLAAVGVGLLGGTAAWVLDRHGWLAGQARVVASSPARREVEVPEPALVGGGGAGCGAPDAPTGATAYLLEGGGAPTCATDEVEAPRSDRHREFGRVVLANGRRLTVYFLAFATLGYLVVELVPSSFFEQHLGDGNALTAVPLAALLGVPVYLNTDGSLPLVASLMDGGMGAGPALAFLVTGAGTSVGALTGMLVVARWRVVALVVGTLLVSACITGWLAPLWLT
ncbi:permease [Ornithinimicrobium kibberense]|uniref:Permease n=1 Tax=Ornithinimicrobium kibberense TaxID=282060 RepID=A0ABV5UZ98_9MICO|nr:permease [Ornithinimicrobium kibberense]